MLFSEAGVSEAVTFLIKENFSIQNKITAVTVYTLGMAILTAVMGNAFAAFPIMSSGVGIPILMI